MNKRIAKPAEQFNLEIDPAYPNHNQKVLEKFAKLIAKECADIADQESKCQGTNIGVQVAERIWHTIRNRFGVE